MNNNGNNINQSYSIKNSNNKIRKKLNKQKTEFQFKNINLPSLGNTIGKSVISFSQKKCIVVDVINNKKIDDYE